MYQTKPITDNIEINKNALRFEDENCEISYSFWGEYGNIGFIITNNNTDNLYLHLDECFYIENGIAYDYYQNRIYSGITYSKAEKRMICIPPQSSKIISEFNITTKLYKNCDILLYPHKNEKNTLDFTQENSPFVFGNRLAYSIGDSSTIIRIRNDFYVSKISNYQRDDITIEVPKEICGKVVPYQTERIFKNSGPDQFYILYNYEYQNDNNPDNQYYERY